MKLRNKITATAAAVALAAGSVLAVTPAQAGNGTGYITNTYYSVQCVQGSLDVYGQWGRYSICPGRTVGGAGLDLDSVFVPGNRVTMVRDICGLTVYYNTRGKGGFWRKVSDCGAVVEVKY